MSEDGQRPASVPPGDVARAIAALANGRVIALPTDTVYGLAASLSHPDAIEHLYDIKGRDATKAIPVLVNDLAFLDHLKNDERRSARCLARAFWPGALTLVVHAPNSIPDAVHRGAGTVGLRMPDHPLARAVISGAGGALAVTSANRSGEPEGLTAADVRAALGDDVPLVIDGGRAPGGRASTVVDLTSGQPHILRLGEISLADIERALREPSTKE